MMQTASAITAVSDRSSGVQRDADRPTVHVTIRDAQPTTANNPTTSISATITPNTPGNFVRMDTPCTPKLC